jgi:hypothetical protein
VISLVAELGLFRALSALGIGQTGFVGKLGDPLMRWRSAYRKLG